jgi:esterase/lipase superfamily enzyme
VREKGSILLPEPNEEPKEELHFILKRSELLPSSTEFGTLLQDSVGCIYYDLSAFPHPKCVSKSPDKPKELLVFIHGHNVTFKQATMRTAQLSVDLDIPSGVFYSWPAATKWASYSRSRKNADKSDTYLLEFLQEVLKTTNAESIHLIAHSMGNRVLMNALEGLQDSPPPVSRFFDQIVFASPDVDQFEFARIAQKINGLSKGMTLYASDRDMALRASSIWPYNKRRAGLAPPRQKLIDATVKLKYIDTSELDRSDYSWKTNLISHSDFTSGAFKDVRYLIRKQRDPDKRCVLSREPDAALKYWITVPKYPQNPFCQMKTYGDNLMEQLKRPVQTFESAQ